MLNKLIAVTVGALASAAALTASAPAVSRAPATTSAVASDPCAFRPTRPAAPTGLRIILGDATDESDGPLSGPHVESGSDDGFVDTGSNAYFDLLSARPDCAVAYSLRSQAELDSIRTGGASLARYDVIYDPDNDAMLQRTLGGGPVSAEQKIPKISTIGTSMLLTWDFKIGSGAYYRGADYLQQHKAYRIDYGDGAFWLTWKLHYARGANSGRGIAEMYMGSGEKKFFGPGTTNPGEILEPRLAEFYPQADTWTRYWFLIEGNIGGGVGGAVVYLSCWAADENREPVRLYNRLAMYTPTTGLEDFRFEFNSSQENAQNDLINIWNRNLVLLHGVTLPNVEALLQKPTR